MGGLASLTREELLSFAAQLEAHRRRLAALDHLVVAELEARGVAKEVGARDTADLLVQHLRLSRRVARRRVADAAALGPRRALTGEPLPPLRPALATAVAAGDISDDHVHVAMTAVDDLPAEVQDEAERFLTEKARELEPGQLRIVARRVVDTLDPDGRRPTEAEHQSRRTLWLERRPDGSAELSGHLTPEAGVKFQTVLDALSAPAPADDAAPDPRTASQRRHDALIDILDRVLHSGTLPDAGGVPTTLVLTTTGRVTRTDHDAVIDPELVTRLTDTADLYRVDFDDVTGDLSLGHTRRLAQPAQRRALAARDRGCSFPNCTVPPAWCQAHHIVGWRAGGPTDLDNLTLLCGHHHRSFETAGWECVMLDSRPHWRPPAWLDPQRRPRRNTAHHLDEFDFEVPVAAA
jgi:hypothetical protein